MAASVAFGMYLKQGVKNCRDNSTMPAVYIFPKGVHTPLALLTAALDKAPFPGKVCKNEFKMLLAPMAMNSCFVFTALPSAGKRDSLLLMNV